MTYLYLFQYQTQCGQVVLQGHEFSRILFWHNGCILMGECTLLTRRIRSSKLVQLVQTGYVNPTLGAEYTRKEQKKLSHSNAPNLRQHIMYLQTPHFGLNELLYFLGLATTYYCIERLNTSFLYLFLVITNGEQLYAFLVLTEI